MIQLLTAVHVVTNIGNKGDIHRNLKNYDSKTLKHPGKSEYKINTLHVLQKAI